MRRIHRSLERSRAKEGSKRGQMIQAQLGPTVAETTATSHSSPTGVWKNLLLQTLEKIL